MGRLTFREARIGIAWTLVGAVSGVVAVERLDPIILNDLLPLVLVVVLYSVCQPRMGVSAGKDVTPCVLSFAGLGLGFLGCIGAGG